MTPLANRVRPTTLSEFVGQIHLVGEGQPLHQAAKTNTLFSMAFWGPPGVGKTTLARILASASQREFFEVSAVSAGKAEIKAILEQAQALPTPPVLFIDELHRFNKAQQDFLLPFVERGDVVFIGATTENPSFEVISALLSRLRIFVLKPLSADEQQILMTRALQELVGSKNKIPKLDENTVEWLVNYANGDGRRLLTLIDSTWTLYQRLDVDALEKSLQSPKLRYDKHGEEHFDTISAFIKSMRASQPDAALYYLARMVEAGEDPLYIARRMVVFAAEDIGTGQPTALMVANSVFEAVHKVGYPEAQIILGFGVTYLAKAKKDRSSYDAYFAALNDVKTHGNLPIPMMIRNAPTALMKELGYGKGYEQYPADTSFLPEKLSKKKYLRET
jgi:putative ATPase